MYGRYYGFLLLVVIQEFLFSLKWRVSLETSVEPYRIFGCVRAAEVLGVGRV